MKVSPSLSWSLLHTLQGCQSAYCSTCAQPTLLRIASYTSAKGKRGAGGGNLGPPHLAPLSRRSVPTLCLAPLPPLTLKMDETWAKVCSKTKGKRQGSEGAMLPPRPTRPWVASLLRPHQSVLFPFFTRFMVSVPALMHQHVSCHRLLLKRSACTPKFQQSGLFQDRRVASAREGAKS